MNRIGNRGHGVTSRLRREVIDIAENGKADNRLEKLISVNKLRIDRLERQRMLARENWRSSRFLLREINQNVKSARQETIEFWENARADFLKMNTTSGQFRKAKAVYERLKQHTSQLTLECKEQIARSRELERNFFSARRDVSAAKKRHEKLDILRGEMQSQSVNGDY